MGKGGAIRWTPEQLAAHEAKCNRLAEQRHDRQQNQAVTTQKQPGEQRQVAGPGEAFYALGRLAKGKMNKTETAYAQRLAALKHDGQILDWRFHALRVRLADNTFYEPDFLVMTAARELQIHETKGSFTTQAGQTKIKLCAEVLPWFRVIKASHQKDGSWILQEFNP